MKKIFIFILIFIITLSSLIASGTDNPKNPEEYAIEEDQLGFEIYKIEKTYSEIKDTNVTVFFYPVYKQVRIVYETDYDLFTTDDAVVSLKRCLEDFTVRAGYYHYSRYKPDEEHSFKRNGKKYTRVISYVLLSK